MSFVPILYPNDFIKYMGYLEIMITIGFVCGPLFGSLFYIIAGFMLPNILLAIISLYLLYDL